MNKYDWLLFDVDNTLYDFKKASPKAFNSTLLKYDIPALPFYYDLYERINSYVWTTYENGDIDAETLKYSRFELFFNQLGITDLDFNQFNKDYLKALIDNTELLDGVRDLLEIVGPHHKMALITNGLSDVQRPRLKKTGLTGVFDHIFSSEDIGFSKPSKAFFDHVFKKIGQPEKAKVLVIGDTLNSDILGGKNYGLPTCWYNPKKIELKINTDVVPRFSDLSYSRFSPPFVTNIIGTVFET